MIVDCHVTVKGNDPYRREFSAEQILRSMDEAGVDRAALIAECLPSRESNDLMYQVCVAATDRFIPFAHVVPTEGILASLELTRALSQLQCRGVKVHLGELDEIVHEQILAVSRRCAEARVPLMIDIAGRLDIVALLATETPDCNTIIAHLGSTTDETLVDKTIALAYEHASLYLETSGSAVPWKLASALQALGSDKIVWGSGGPLVHPAIELAKLRALRLDDEAFQRITCDNILGLVDAPR